MNEAAEDANMIRRLVRDLNQLAHQAADRGIEVQYQVIDDSIMGGARTSILNVEILKRL